ncbi:MAG: ScyD/ScyE family protein [Actinobacteria bacterium]|nr:ScyD/ScyE family protein [Actinomycetota bacterium]
MRATVLTVALLGQGAVALPAAAEGHPRVEVVADGLDNPRGITVADDGTVYVAQAGSGGDDYCHTVEEGDEQFELCFGTTGSIAAVSDGQLTTVVDQLPSYLFGEGEAIGASDVSLAPDGSLYLSLGLGGYAGLRDEIAQEFPPAAMFGTVQHLAGGELGMVADLSAWEEANDPSAGQPSTEGEGGAPSNDSNPNSVLATAAGGLFAADAGGNTVLEIDPATGDIQLRAFLEDRFVDAPPFMGAPEGTQIPMQAVPTSLAEDPDGEVAFGQLTGFPFPVGGAHVYGFGADETPETIAEGFTNVMDVTYLDGELYVLEIAHDSLLAGPTGALVRVRSDGTRIALLRDVLFAPGGVAAGPDGMLYITNNSIGEPGAGEILRFDPSLAADPATQSACPPLDVPGTDLTGITDTAHEEAITCTVWHGLFGGFPDGSFAPAGDISRGQLASTVARMVRATGTELPDGGGGRFSDVDGTAHDDAINDLAAAGLVEGFEDGSYRPNTSVTRAQSVSVLVRAYEFVTGEELPPGPDAFDDDDGAHEGNINAAAGMGWVAGTSPRTFSPGADVSRGQMASVLARIASDLVDEGHLQLPA